MNYFRPTWGATEIDLPGCPLGKLEIEQFSLEGQKVIGFALLCYTIGLKNLRHFSSNQKQNQNQLWLICTCFSTLRISCMYLLQVFIGSLDCLCPLWLARVTTLVLVLRHSIKNALLIVGCCLLIRQVMNKSKTPVEKPPALGYRTGLSMHAD